MNVHLTAEAFDALLAGKASDEIREHLAECAICAEIWEDIARGHAFMLQAPTVSAPAGLHARVVDALEEVPWRPPARSRLAARRVWVSAAAVILLLLAGGGMVGMTILVLSSVALAPVVRALANVWHVGIRFALDLLEILFLFLKITVGNPWLVPMLALALLLVLLAMWTTRFYSRRLYA